MYVFFIKTNVLYVRHIYSLTLCCLFILFMVSWWTKVSNFNTGKLINLSFMVRLSLVSYLASLSVSWVLLLCSVAKWYPTLSDPMDCSTPGFPILHYLLEFAQTHVHWVSDALQPSHSSATHFSSCSQSFPASGSFPTNWPFAIRWPKYCSFSISPFDDYSEFIQHLKSSRMLLLSIGHGPEVF